MKAQERRDAIMQMLKASDGPISAGSLAGVLRVSRQAVVGDIALLRATGCAITATARGYILTERLLDDRYTGKVVCIHEASRALEELYIIVDGGGEVLDVRVDHDLYGEIVGRLHIASRADADAFVDKISKSSTKLLTELTYGLHRHTIATRDADAFEAINRALHAAGLADGKGD